VCQLSGNKPSEYIIEPEKFLFNDRFNQSNGILNTVIYCWVVTDTTSATEPTADSAPKSTSELETW